jgi:hypothetical protein
MDPEDEVIEGEENLETEQDEPAEPDEGEGSEGTGEGADEDGGEGEVDAQPARKPSRAQSRIQTLTDTLKAEKAERQRIDRELADIRAAERQRQQQTQQESPEAKATRRALMDPLEVMREDLRESEQRTKTLLHQQALQAQETNDQVVYKGILRDAPHLKKYEAEVEKLRTEQQARGYFVPRETLLDLAVGRAARAAAVKGAPKAKAAGQQRVAAQQSKAAGARGDAATQRGKQGDSAEKRLLNVPI